MKEKSESKKERHRKQQQKYFQKPEKREKNKNSCKKYWLKNKEQIKKRRRKRQENLVVKLAIARELYLFNDEIDVSIINDDKLWSSSIIKENKIKRQQVNKQNILQITNSWHLGIPNDALLDINLNLFDDIILNDIPNILQEHNYSLQVI